MRLALPKELIRAFQRAVIEFDLLSAGDRVLVGLSGGKDSIFLLYALAVYAKHLPFSIDISAFTVDLGFKNKEEMDWRSLEKICRKLNVSYRVQRAELANNILHHPTQNPCARCAYFRRAIIHNYAKSHAFNKVAFAHHYDDAVETFLMSILYSGQIRTFLPKLYLDKTGVTVIRPLVYLREKEITEFIKELGIEPISSSCEFAGYTKRAEVKELLQELSQKNENVFANLAIALRDGRQRQLWPQELSKEEINQKSQEFWYGGKDKL